MRPRMRADTLLCTLVSALVAMLVGKGVQWFADKSYVEYVEEHMVAAGEIGGIAGEDVFRAQSVADLLEHDTFTVISPGIQWHNNGNGYYHESKWGLVRNFRALQLPSGEMVAAHINAESVQRPDGVYVGCDNILPVGRVVYEDLTQDQVFLDQIEFLQPLSRTDFYVDMMGNGGKVSQEYYTELPVGWAQIIMFVIVFPLLHVLGVRIGLFPYYYFPPKDHRKKKEENDLE